jgi:protein-tyrosine-phosphatase
MAEAFAKSGLHASGAGTRPSASVNPFFVEVMRERGIDLTGGQAENAHC